MSTSQSKPAKASLLWTVACIRRAGFEVKPVPGSRTPATLYTVSGYGKKYTEEGLREFAGLK